MSNNQNQGASIEAERACEACGGPGYINNGGYIFRCRVCKPDERRTPAAQVGAGELPPLPMTKAQYGLDHTLSFSAIDMRNYARAAIEADRARQAVPDRILQARDAYIAELEQRLADLRAQLAAKGQGAPVAYMGIDGNVYAAHVHGGPICTTDKPLYAAPASAQPADDRQHMSHTDMLALCAANPAAASGLPLGAQPDQRESGAATVSISPMFLASAAFCIENHGSVKPETRQQMIDKLLDLSERMENAKQTAVVASPAAQPAKDEQIAAVQEAYGYLWHVNAAHDAPPGIFPVSLTPESAAYKARRVLRDLLTHEQRGQGINAAREALQSQDSANTGADEQKGGAE